MADYQNCQWCALLVEDDPFMRQSVDGFLSDMGFQVVAVSSYGQAMDILADHIPTLRLAVVDISLPELNDEDTTPRKPFGLAVARHIKQTQSHVGVVVWSAYTHYLADVLALIEEGYRGLAYIPKGNRAETVRLVIELVLTGDVYLSSSAIAKSSSDAEQHFLRALRPQVAHAVKEVETNLTKLSPKQYQVATLMALRPDAIARELGLKEKTVRNYIDQIYEALGLKDADVQDLHREALVILSTLLCRLPQST